MIKRGKNRKIGIACWILILNLALAPVAGAQVSLDGSLGTAGDLAGPDYQIPGSLGQIQGTNLFHSFSQFDLNNTESATFSGPDAIANIFSRVTGGQASTIDGLLKSDIPDASLYFFNPAGVVFGPNASLDIGGAFFTGTADYIRLGQDGIFHTRLSETSVLTASSPAAFGFLAPLPAGVDIKGSYLPVQDGKQLSVMAGDISLEADTFLAADSGRINLVSAASAGEVELAANAINTTGFSQMGEISMAANAYVYASGDSGGDIYIRSGRLTTDAANIWAETQGTGPQGSVTITADDDIALDNGTVVSASSIGTGNAGDVAISAKGLALTNGSDILTISLDQGAGGDISINTSDSLTLSGPDNGSFSGIMAYTSVAAAPAGDVSIKTGTFTMDNHTVVNANAGGSGNSGFITVDTDATAISGGSQILNNIAGGKGGSIQITARDSLILSGKRDGYTSGLFSASNGTGQGGDIMVSAGDCLVDNGRIGALALEQGDAGSVSVTSDNLQVLNGGAIDAYTEGAGNAGSVIVTAAQSILMDGGDSDGYYSRLAAYTNGSGSGGSLILDAPDIRLSNGATIYNRTYQTGPGGDIAISGNTLELTGTSQISCSTFGPAPGGTLSIQTTESVVLSGSQGTDASGLFAASYGAGDGGQILITSPFIDISGGGLVQGTSTDTGKGGDLILTGDTIQMTGGGVVSSGAEGDGDGGSISLTASDQVIISGKNASFFSGLYANTSAAGKSGDIAVTTNKFAISDQGGVEAGGIQSSGTGGDIIVSASQVHLSGQGSISTRSTGSGNAGNISITATDTLFLDNSEVTTEAGFADGGNIQVAAGNLVRLDASDITATVGGGLGNGGNIDVDPVFIVLDNSRVIANAFQGNGGNIHLVADYFFADPESRISASSQLGIDGTVAIETPNIDLSAAFSTLPEYRQIPALGNDRCQSGGDGDAGSLIRVGRGGLPLSPAALTAEILPATDGP